MTSLLQELNNESLLLMYLADELPAEDRADLEQMLASNPALQTELETLREAYTGAAEALRSADKRERMPISSNIASRRVGRAVQSWHARRLSMPASQREGRGLRLPWWAYPLASSAAVVLVIVSWWSMNPDRGPTELRPTAPMLVVETDEEDSEPDSAAVPWEAYAVAPDASDSLLDDTEDELYALAKSGDNASDVFLMSDTDEQ